MENLTKDELIVKRTQLETELNEVQDKLANQTYGVDLENMSNLKALLKQIDKSYTWNIKNAAFVINLYDNLNNTRIAIQKSGDESFVVELKSLDLNTLYKVLTSIEGTGIESAKTFTRLLTNVGKQITDAMNEMAEANKEIQQGHVALAELDAVIDELTKQESAEEVEADEITQ
jgi:hypothetical protein